MDVRFDTCHRDLVKKWIERVERRRDGGRAKQSLTCSTPDLKSFL